MSSLDFKLCCFFDSFRYFFLEKIVNTFLFTFELICSPISWLLMSQIKIQIKLEKEEEEKQQQQHGVEADGGCIVTELSVR